MWEREWRTQRHQEIKMTVEIRPFTRWSIATAGVLLLVLSYVVFWQNVAEPLDLSRSLQCLLFLQLATASVVGTICVLFGIDPKLRKQKTDAD